MSNFVDRFLDAQSEGKLWTLALTFFVEAITSLLWLAGAVVLIKVLWQAI